MTASGPAEHLGYASATPSERWWALLVALTLLGGAYFAVRFGQHQWPAYDALLPAVYSAAVIAMFVSAAILRNQYRASRFAPFAFLSTAYATTAAVLVPYLVLYPRAFSPTSFGTGAQATNWLWIEWHATFILSVAVYVIAEQFFAGKPVDNGLAAGLVRGYVVLVIALAEAAVITTIVFHDRLPVLFSATHGYTPLFHFIAEQLMLGLSAIVFIALMFRGGSRDTMHLWLAAVVVALIIEIYLSGEFARRPFTEGWYMSVVAALVWQGLLLAAQLQHANEQMEAYGNQARTLIEETLRDALTGLYNRRGFDERFEDALEITRNEGKPIGLIALDLDYFKSFNDHYGHVAGDEALRRIGDAIASVANRVEDTCCRIGGEEFAIVLPETDEAGTLTVAERVRAAVIRLKIPHAPTAPQDHMTVSIGVAGNDGRTKTTSKALYESADQALYRAKRMGRNRIATARGRSGAMTDIEPPEEEVQSPSAQAG
jgi:diguanylate cyclase (GGDEF)-like protein